MRCSPRSRSSSRPARLPRRECSRSLTASSSSRMETSSWPTAARGASFASTRRRGNRRSTPAGWAASTTSRTARDRSCMPPRPRASFDFRRRAVGTLLLAGSAHRPASLLHLTVRCTWSKATATEFCASDRAAPGGSSPRAASISRSASRSSPAVSTSRTATTGASSVSLPARKLQPVVTGLDLPAALTAGSGGSLLIVDHVRHDQPGKILRRLPDGSMQTLSSGAITAVTSVAAAGDGTLYATSYMPPFVGRVAADGRLVPLSG